MPKNVINLFRMQLTTCRNKIEYQHKITHFCIPISSYGAFTLLETKFGSNGLMGVCHEICYLFFSWFQFPTHLGPPINWAKYFRIRSWFRRDIRSQISKNSLRGVQTNHCYVHIQYSYYCRTKNIWIQKLLIYRVRLTVLFRGVIDTVELKIRTFDSDIFAKSKPYSKTI